MTGGHQSRNVHYLAAKAQLTLAQPARDAIRAVRLAAPLMKSLEVKRDALENAMNACPDESWSDPSRRPE